MDFALAATGMAIGLSVAAPLGPVNLIVIRAALRHGVLVALLTGCGAVVADTLFAALAAFGARSIEDAIIHYAAPLAIIGGLLLVAIGIRTATHHVNLAEIEASHPGGGAVARQILTTFTLTATNPGSLIAFLAIFGTMAPVLRLAASPDRPLLAVAGVALGGLVWWAFLGWLIARVRLRLNRTVLDRINRWAGVLIAAFGFALLMEVLT